MAAALCGHDGRRGLIYQPSPLGYAVAPECRVGKVWRNRFFKMGLQGLRDAGVVRAIILVAKDNPSGQEFWLSQGFEAIFGARFRLEDGSSLQSMFECVESYRKPARCRGWVR